MTADVSSLAQLKASFRRIPEEIYNTGAVEAADEIMVADYVEHIPLPPGYTPDREGFVRFVEMWRTAVPDLTYTVTHFTADDLIGEETQVMHRVVGRGTHLGEMMGIPATGRPLEWTEMHIGRFEDGSLVEHWGQIDVLRIMQGVGAAPGSSARPSEAAPPDVEDEPEPDPEELRELVARYVREIWSDGRLEVADELVHAGAVHAANAPLPAGPDGLKQDVASFREGFPDLRLELEDAIVEYPYAVGRLAGAGTHGGDFMGVPSTGRGVAFGMIEVLQVAGGRIVARWSLADLLGLLGQLTS
jgi:predicted ester cyclase